MFVKKVLLSIQGTFIPLVHTLNIFLAVNSDVHKQAQQNSSKISCKVQYVTEIAKHSQLFLVSKTYFPNFKFSIFYGTILDLPVVIFHVD